MAGQGPPGCSGQSDEDPKDIAPASERFWIRQISHVLVGGEEQVVKDQEGEAGALGSIPSSGCPWAVSFRILCLSFPLSKMGIIMLLYLTQGLSG